MVDVSSKEVTRRRAVARAFVRMTPETAAAVAAGDAPKGDVLGIARIAGIQAAKQTGALIPLCHPLGLDHVDVRAAVVGGRRGDRGRGIGRGPHRRRDGGDGRRLRRGAHVYDMVKGIERGVSIESVELIAKSGGRSGDWQR